MNLNPNKKTIAPDDHTEPALSGEREAAARDEFDPFPSSVDDDDTGAVSAGLVRELLSQDGAGGGGLHFVPEATPPGPGDWLRCEGCGAFVWSGLADDGDTCGRFREASPPCKGKLRRPSGTARRAAVASVEIDARIRKGAEAAARFVRQYMPPEQWPVADHGDSEHACVGAWLVYLATDAQRDLRALPCSEFGHAAELWRRTYFAAFRRSI